MVSRAALGLLAMAGCGRLGFEDRALLAGGDAGRRSDGSAMQGDALTAVCPAFAIFCDDFESGDLTKWDYVDAVSKDEAKAQTAEFHSGSFALEAYQPTTTTYGVSAVVFGPGQRSTGILAVREWIRPIEPLTSDSVVGYTNYTDYTSIGGDANG